MTAGRRLWTCPKCGRSFVTRNMPHSCGPYSVRAFLEGKSRSAVALYRCFARLVRDCGPVRIAPARTRIGFQVRMIFAAVNKLDDRGLDAHVVLTRRLGSPRFRRIESLAPRSHVHHFRIGAASELDQEVRDWLREAYRVGTQEHLLRRAKARP